MKLSSAYYNYINKIIPFLRENELPTFPFFENERNQLAQKKQRFLQRQSFRGQRLSPGH